MNKEDGKLKRHLVLQSFCPLFILVFIKHFKITQLNLLVKFFSYLIRRDWSAFEKMWHHAELGGMVITITSITWIIYTIVISMGVDNLQRSGFDSNGEKLKIVSEKKDSGASFMVTFIIPLLIDDVNTLNGFLLFFAILFMLIYLLEKSDLFYQNPVLAALQYKAFEFQFINPYGDVDDEKTYIGLCKCDVPYKEKTIQRRYIAADVFFIQEEPQ